MAGTVVEAVVITNPGKDYTSAPSVSFSGGGGSGAAATASVLTYDGTNVVCMFKARGNDLYGVDGKGRGFRWDGDTDYLEPLGITRPASAPTVAVTAGGSSGAIRSITIVNGGAGYSSAPQVVFSGGGLTDGSTLHAKGRARIGGARVVGVTVDSRGGHYTSTPHITFSGGVGAGATLSVGVNGRLAEVRVTAGGSGYTSTPPITGTPSVSLTGNSSDDQITAVGHGLTNGHSFYFTSLSGSTDFSLNATYYAVTASATQFSVAATSSGTALDITSAITAGRLVNPSTHLFIQCSNHGLTNGSTTVLSGLSGGSGLVAGLPYFVVNANATQFKLAATSGGDPVEFTTALTIGSAAIPAPVVTINTTQGLTNARIELTAANGQINTAFIAAAGSGATTSGQTFTITGGAGSGATLEAGLSYTVSSITVVGGGTGYMAPPSIGFRPTSGGALAIAAVTNGSISAATVLSGGDYSEPPSVVVEPVEAKAIAHATQPMLGKYRCCIRYLDDTTTARRGPHPSSISAFQTVAVDTESSVFEWAWSNAEAESRVHQIELWRTTADQQLVLYRVAILDKVAGALPTSYTDFLSDNDLLDAARAGFGIMPIVLTNGQINARRFEPPKTTCSQACVFQDRAWYSVDTTGEKPNSIWHSEVDEPESAPDLYEIIIQENHGDSDAIVALRPFGPQLLVFQNRHLYAIQYVSQPLIDASIQLAAYRGLLNARCHDAYDGVLFAADSAGMYAFDGRSIDTISVPIDNFWRDGVIDFSKSKQFFVKVNPSERVVRFYYCKSGDSSPVRALCFCISTKAWWEETYASARTAAVEVLVAGRAQTITAGTSFVKQSVGGSDSGGTPYLYRSGPYPVDDGPSRSIGVLYTPSPNTLEVRTHYNGSDSPRANAIAADRGDGFLVTQGSTAATLNMATDRSTLGASPGYARAYLSGRANDRSAGADKHLAVAVAGQKTGSSPVIVHAVTVEGVRE
jgi:hypothetical protein